MAAYKNLSVEELKELKTKLDAEFEELSMDASIVQAHQHSAGAKKGGLPLKSAGAEADQIPKSMPS